MSGKDKWVRRFTVDETARHKNGFTIYKITSVLFPLTSPEAGTIVSVWKRFSEVQRLRRGMRALHAGLALTGDCPKLPTRSFFKRFDAEVLQERCQAIKQLLEFIAEHRLLFASTEFVNFLQTGYAEPAGRPPGVINEIRSALHLPIEDSPPLEYQTDDEDRSPGREDTHDSTDGVVANQTGTRNEIDVSDIQIFEAADVEMRNSPETKNTDSSESLNSLESLKSDLFEEVTRMTIDKPKAFVKKKSVLPDLIDFNEPSTSRFDDYHTMRRTSSSTVSLSSTYYDGAESTRSHSRVSQCSQAAPIENYVFEAGLVLQQAARCERAGDQRAAFRLYKRGVHALLLGVRSDNDPQRRALIRKKTETYLAHAEALYNNHIAGADVAPPPPPPSPRASRRAPLPPQLLRREYEELGQYRPLAVLRGRLVLALRPGQQERRVIKVIQKIPNNLTEFDEFMHHQQNETKQLILPTNIPFMVSLDCYIETPNLIFLVLEYAPGQNLFEYIKNYVKSIPNTPARELNLENVFVDPQKATLGDIQNRNDSETVDAKAVLDSAASIVDKLESSRNNNGESDKVTEKTDNIHDSEISVNELVINSQKLLLNVSKVLNEEPKTILEENESNDKGVKTDDVQIDVVDKAETNMRREGRKAADIPNINTTVGGIGSLPPSAVCRWAAQLLLALGSLHGCGLRCRDLKSSNILLGKRGQILLTYCCGYPPGELPPPPLPRGGAPPPPHLAPELYEPGGDAGESVCDFWSYGVILYELICGVPPARRLGRAPLPVPRGLSVEAESILTQLLCPDPSERLGARGIDEIKQHPYFKNIDWQDVYDSWLMPD